MIRDLYVSILSGTISQEKGTLQNLQTVCLTVIKDRFQQYIEERAYICYILDEGQQLLKLLDQFLKNRIYLTIERALRDLKNI